MWQKKVKKTVFVLNVENFAPEITELTYPLIKAYAKRIGADFYAITERKFPEFPVTYEKLQIYELGQEMENDWNIYIDSDALVHPETLDWTLYLPKDTVAHNGRDMASIRWKYDRFFMRDGRNIGSCNWFTVASDLCIDLWKPFDDLTPEEAIDNINPTVTEINTLITPEHLIDDYALSRNIAKYGLKFKTFQDILHETGIPDAGFFWHLYTIPVDQKINGWDTKNPDGTITHNPGMKDVISGWGIPEYVKRYAKHFI